MNRFPNDDILVSTDWLKHNCSDPNLRILDVRVSDPRLPVGYRFGHIPNAIAFDLQRDLYTTTDRGRELASHDQIARTLGERGISNDSTIVLYDEWGERVAGTVYWALRYVGHREVRVLEGGWAKWVRAGGTVSDQPPQFGAVEYRADPKEDYRATAEWIRSNSDRDDLVLLDTRSAQEFGMGHIPRAVNLSHDLTLDPQTQSVRDADSLLGQLSQLGANPDKEIVVYCATGARSSMVFQVLQMLGYNRVRNYDGSMMDWSQIRGMPIE